LEMFMIRLSAIAKEKNTKDQNLYEKNY